MLRNCQRVSGKFRQTQIGSRHIKSKVTRNEEKINKKFSMNNYTIIMYKFKEEM